MKHSTSMYRLASVCVVCLFRVAPGHAAPYDVMQNQVIDERMKAEIAPPQQPLPIDDYLVALAKSTRTNFIADVTELPKETRVDAFPAGKMARISQWTPKFYRVLWDFTQEYKVSQLRYSPTTFLFWSEPDPLELTRSLISASLDKPTSKVPKAKELLPLLLDFAKEKNTRDGQPSRLSFNATMAELPPELRDKLTALAGLPSPGVGTDLSDWLTDDFWKTARVRVQVTRRQPFNTYNLQVFGADAQSANGGLTIEGFSLP
ncbi:MAG TPA: hypothetical protein VF600_06425 [Abditibacteriaceae bacterium]